MKSLGVVMESSMDQSPVTTATTITAMPVYVLTMETVVFAVSLLNVAMALFEKASKSVIMEQIMGIQPHVSRLAH